MVAIKVILSNKKGNFFVAGLWGPLGTPAMVLSVGIDYWDDIYASTAPTTHSDGGDRSERVRDLR